MRLLLLLLLCSMSQSHWMCDEAGFFCEDSNIISQMCFWKVDDLWFKPIIEHYIVKTDLNCYLYCQKKGCLCGMYLNGFQCLLMMNDAAHSITVDWTDPPLLVTIGSNAALNKTVLPPSPSSSSLLSSSSEGAEAMVAKKGSVSSGVAKAGENSPVSSVSRSTAAVDGLVIAKIYFQRSGLSDPWFMVDLDGSYKIRGIRLIPRLDSVSQFESVLVMVGNNYANPGNFSSFTTIKTIQGPPPCAGCWYSCRFTLKDAYKFLAIQRISTSGPTLLELTELEVLV